ncbi:MAG: hypothetical protein JO210_02670 [Acidobacteriaceae bacterium]|nr:hypothetical protein [Acidobacteriaceae bacterium]
MTPKLTSFWSPTRQILDREITRIPAPACDLQNGPKASFWQLGSAKGEAIWAWVTAAFAVYWILFVTGAFLGRKELNAVGGVLVLGVLSCMILERLWVRLDAVFIACFAAAIGIPLLQLIVLSEPISAEALFKHISLCMVMAASRVLNLPVVCRSRVRWLLALQVLLILLISFTIFRGTSWDGGTRHSGLFVNPNNLALIPFLLLFLMDPLRDKKLVRLTIHAIVVAVLAFSGTTGAVLAYAIGLVVNYRKQIPKHYRTFVYTLIPLTAVVGVAFFAANGASILPETRMTKQIEVIGGQLRNVLQGGDIAYYEQERVLGPGTASGIWRVAHWRRTVTAYLDGTPLEQLVGFGFGSSPRILGKLPHNEYLRTLFEQGILGLFLFIFAWRRIIMTAPQQVRYIGLIVAIYSFSENNLDNFPFMALFILFLSARDDTDSVAIRVPRRRSPMWNPVLRPAA